MRRCRNRPPTEVLDETSGRPFACPEVLGPSPEELSELPRQIGKYTVTRFLARGGMGEVYLAWHPDLKMPVAIKRMRPDLLGSADRVERFMQESRLLCRLNHPNIVRVYDVDRDANRQPFIVQEYVDGNDLADAIEASERGHLSVDESLRIMRQVTAALMEAHRHGIVHRDIKPANILMTRKGEPKLADLGIAKVMDRAAPPAREAPLGITGGGSSMGSPIYCAPEQLADASQVDERADIYGLGVTFYKMLTGEVPFAAASPREMVMKLRHEALPDPREAVPSIPRAVAQIVRRMLRREPRRRYQTAAAVSRALSGLKLERHWLRLWVPLAAALAVAAGAGLLATWEGDRATLTQVQRHLAAGESDQALRMAEAILRREPDQIPAIYAQGLCALHAGREILARDAAERLEALNAREYAGHLRAMLLLFVGDPSRAYALAGEWSSRAKRKLPFMLCQAMVSAESNRVDEAETLLTRALDQEPFFAFQRYYAADQLGALLMRKGAPEQAVAAYERVLPPRGNPMVPPRLYHSYAVALKSIGADDRAREVLADAVRVRPDDEVADYLRRRSEVDEARQDSETLVQTMEMLRAVNADLDRGGDSRRPMGAPPIVLEFLPPRGAEGLGRAELERWRERIVDRMHDLDVFPVVDRRNLGTLLVEHAVSAGRRSGAGSLAGKLLPASVMIEPRLSRVGGATVIKLKLIDVASSEIIDVIRRAIPPGVNTDQAVRGLCGDLTGCLRAHAEAFGLVTGVTGHVAEINIGRCHGLEPGQRLHLLASGPEDGVEALRRRRPDAIASVTELRRFSASVTVDAGVEVKPNMAVVAISGGASKTL